MNNSIKNVLSIILAFALPIGLIIVVALKTYLPSILNAPKYDFIYVVCKNYVSVSTYNDQCTDASKYFYIDGKKLKQRNATTDKNDDNDIYWYGMPNDKIAPERLNVTPIEPSIEPYPNQPKRRLYARDTILPTIYYYDANKNQSTEISFSDATKFSIYDSQISPDGFTLIQERPYSTFPFSRDMYDIRHYLKKGSYEKRINLNDKYKTNNYLEVDLIGWVLPLPLSN